MLYLLALPILLSVFLSASLLSFRFLVKPPLGFRISFLAFPIGFISGLAFIGGSIVFPPKEAYQWIFLAGLFGGLWPYLALSGEPLSLRTFRKRFFALGIFIFISFHSSFATDLKLIGFLYILALFLAVSFWTFSEKLVPPRLFPLCSFLTATGLSFFFLFSGSFRMAQMMGVFTAVLGVATFWNQCFFFYPVGLHLIPFVIFVWITFLLSYEWLFEYPISIFFIFSPFWLAWIFYYLKLRFWKQSVILLFFSFPFSFYVLYRLFKQSVQ